MLGLEEFDKTTDSGFGAIEIDQFSEVRHLHALAFRILTNGHHSTAQIHAFERMVYSQAYTHLLVGNDLWGVWLGRNLLATAGWSPAGDSGTTARITDVFVHPMFRGEGLGGLVVASAEQRAHAAGFVDFSARVGVNAVPFFEILGYSITSHGARPLGQGIDVPITFMRKSAER